MTQQNDAAPPPQYSYQDGAKGTLAGWSIDDTDTGNPDLAGYSRKQLEKELHLALNNDPTTSKLALLLTLLQNHISDNNNPHRDDALSLAPDMASSFLGNMFRGCLPSRLPIFGFNARNVLSCNSVPGPLKFSYGLATAGSTGADITYYSNRTPEGKLLTDVQPGDVPCLFFPDGTAGSPILGDAPALDVTVMPYPIRASVISPPTYVRYNPTSTHAFGFLTKYFGPETNYYTFSLDQWLGTIVAGQPDATLYVTVHINLDTIVMAYNVELAAAKQPGAWSIFFQSPGSTIVPIIPFGGMYPTAFRGTIASAQFSAAVMSLNAPVVTNNVPNNVLPEDQNKLATVVPAIATDTHVMVVANPVEMVYSGPQIASVLQASINIGTLYGSSNLSLMPDTYPLSLWGLGVGVILPLASFALSGTTVPYITVLQTNGVTIKACRYIDTSGNDVTTWNVQIRDRIGIFMNSTITGTGGRIAIATNATQLLIRAGGNEVPQIFDVTARDVDLGGMVANSPGTGVSYLLEDVVVYNCSFLAEQLDFLVGGDGV